MLSDGSYGIFKFFKMNCIAAVVDIGFLKLNFPGRNT